MDNDQRCARIREIEAQPTGMITVAQIQEELILLAELCTILGINWRAYNEFATWRLKMLTALKANGIDLISAEA